MRRVTKLNQVRDCNISKSEHQRRKELYAKSGEDLRNSILSQLDKNEFKDMLISGDYPLLDVIKEKHAVALAQNPIWKDKRFGAVGLVGRAGCLVFTTYNMLYLLGMEKGISVQEILEIVVRKGYRMWKFSNRREALNWPEVTLDRIKETYPDEDVQKCTSTEEAEAIIGKPWGIGGSMYFIDEVIAFLAKTRPYEDTRIWSYMEMLDNLHKGIPVPIRVNNAIYKNDESLKQGHYANLVGFDKDGNAVLVDSHTEGGFYKCPYDSFFRAVIADPGYISAWNCKDLAK